MLKVGLSVKTELEGATVVGSDRVRYHKIFEV